MSRQDEQEIQSGELNIETLADVFEKAGPQPETATAAGEDLIVGHPYSEKSYGGTLWITLDLDEELHYDLLLFTKSGKSGKMQTVMRFSVF